MDPKIGVRIEIDMDWIQFSDRSILVGKTIEIANYINIKVI